MLMKSLATAAVFGLVLSATALAQTHAPIVDTPPEPGVVPGCGHYAIIGAARTLDGAFDLQSHLGAIGSGVLDTGEVPQFRDGYFSVVFGPFGTRAQADGRAAAWRARAPDVYVAYGCVAGVEDRPGAPGPLPVSRGVYVMDGIACAQPPNSAFRVYDGNGISGSATRACRFTLEDREGALYGSTNSCEDTYSGDRSETALSVRLLGLDRFRLAEDGAVKGEFRLCPALFPADFGGGR